MLKKAIPAIVITTLLLSPNGFADEISPSDLAKRVAAAYASTKTYKAKGAITIDSKLEGRNGKTETAFTILLKKPNLYLIRWTQKTSVGHLIYSQSGAVWSDGDQPFFCSGNRCWKAKSDELALAGATDVSGGATFTIPSLFLLARKYPVPLRRLKEPIIERSEKVEGEDCYVISGSSRASKKETYWVSKKDFLIRKYSRSLEAPAGGMRTAKMNDNDIKAAVTKLGHKPTEELIAYLKESMRQDRGKMTGFSTELHADISSPELSKTDFRFVLPRGAVFGESESVR